MNRLSKGALAAAAITVAIMGQTAVAWAGTSAGSPSSTGSHTGISSTLGTKVHKKSPFAFINPDATTVGSVTVTPNSNLTGGQTVTVSVSGFPTSDKTIAVLQCEQPFGNVPSCGVKGVIIKTTSGGKWSGPFTVVEGALPGATDGATCAVGSTNCYIAVGTIDQKYGNYASIAFAAPVTTTTTTTTIKPSGGSTTTTTVGSGGTTTTTASGSGATTTTVAGSVSSGSGSSSGSGKLANTGAPAHLTAVEGTAVLIIAAGLLLVAISRAQRSLRLRRRS